VRTCEHTRPDGEPCGAHVLAGRNYCYFHDESTAEARSARSAKGGRARLYPEAIGDWTSRTIDTTEDLRIGMATAFNAGMLGQISASQMSALSQAASVLLRLLDPPKPEDQGDPNSLRDHVLEFIEKDHPELKADFVAHLREKDAAPE
jgi:hypothetical protein